MFEELNDENFLLYCAKHYDNHQCVSTEEFFEDLKRIKYLKKLLTKYDEKTELNERLILNHITILNNIFGPVHLPRILYLKLNSYYKYIKPFLLLLEICPELLYNINNQKVIDVNTIPMDSNIIRVLRENYLVEKNK